jgi:heat-inducible transcriptional repressor
MAGRAAGAMDGRVQEVLRLVIKEHVRTGDPVSSRSVARSHPERLSPATIRSIMADLTDAGYLAQPHTSAGRVPTDRGYRQFVDEVLASRRGLPAREARRIEELLLSSRELENLLAQAGRLLSRLTHQVGVVLAPDVEQALLEHIEFVRIAPSRVVAIFVSRAGLVIHRVVDTDEDIGQEDLDRFSARLREHFAGLTLPEVRLRLLASLREDRAWAEQLGQRASRTLSRVLEEPFPEESGELILEGTSQLLEMPEFADLRRVKDVMRLFDERTKLLRLLDRCLEGSGVQVVIGSEARDPGMAPMSVVTSPYRAGEELRGLVGIVGPRRMEYARAVCVVDHFARVISRALGGGAGGSEEEQ